MPSGAYGAEEAAPAVDPGAATPPRFSVIPASRKRFASIFATLLSSLTFYCFFLYLFDVLFLPFIFVFSSFLSR